jgi:hypothetical protein
MTCPVIGSSVHSRGCLRRTSTRETVRAGTPSSAPIQSGPRRSRVRNSTMRSSTSAGVRVGLVCGLLDRSTSPASPSAAWRVSQVRTHLREIPIAAAMCACFQPARCRATISWRP